MNVYILLLEDLSSHVNAESNQYNRPTPPNNRPTRTKCSFKYNFVLNFDWGAFHSGEQRERLPTYAHVFKVERVGHKKRLQRLRTLAHSQEEVLAYVRQFKTK